MENKLYSRTIKCLLVCGFLSFYFSACQSTQTPLETQPAGFWDGLPYGLGAPFLAPLIWLKGAFNSFPNLRLDAFTTGVKAGLIWDAAWMLGIIGTFVIGSTNELQDLIKKLGKGDFKSCGDDLVIIWFIFSLASIAGSLVGLLLYFLLPVILIWGGVLADLIFEWFKKHL